MKEDSNDLETFVQLFKNDLEKKLATIIHDKQILLIMEGGKRLRSLLAILSYKVCTKGKESHNQYQKALEGAVLIEIACTASLVHEFIIKMDKGQRGKRSHYLQKIINDAILNGHKLLISGINIALDHGEDITQLIVKTWDDILTGELMDVDFDKKEFENLLYKTSLKSKYFDKYNKIINMKTASLFSSACKAGAIEAHQSGDYLDIFADYGREVGISCQLADDLIEFKTGKRSISIAFFYLNKLKKKNINNIFLGSRIIKKFNKSTSEIQNIYIKEIEKRIRNAEKLGKSKKIPSSNYKNMLIDAPTYIVNNLLKEINIKI